MEKRVIGYIRVSTDRKEQESSILNQKLMLQNKYGNNVEVIADVGSGLKLKTRPNFVKLLTDKCGLKIIQGTDKNIFIDVDNTKEKEVDLIVVKSISRFSRNAESVQILNKLAEKGVHVFFEDIQKSTEGQDNALIINLLLSIAQQESLNTSQRIKQAFEISAKQNKLLGNNIYGYKYIQNENKLVVIPEEAEIVKIVFSLCIGGKGARVIANELNKMGVKTQRGNNFSASSIKNMIRNIKYTGTNFRGKFSNINIISENARVITNEDVMYQKSENIESIISMEIWNKANECLKSRVTNADGSSTGRNYIKDKYREKCVCGVCGGKMYVTYSSKNYKNVGKVKYSYITCSDKKNKGKDYCNNQNIQLEKFEEVIEEQYQLYNEHLSMYNHIRYAELQVDLELVLNSNTDNLANENTLIKENIEQLKQQTSNVINGLINATNSTVADMMNKKINEISNEIEKLENSLKNNNNIINNRNAEIVDIKNKMKQVEYDIQNPKKLTRDEFINFIDKIEIKDKEISVMY